MRNPGIIVILVVMTLISCSLDGQSVLDNTSFNTLSVQEKVDTLSALCWQLREKDTDLAIEYAEVAMNIARENDFKKELGCLYNYLGVIYQHYKHQVGKAIPLYNEGLLLSLQVKDSMEIAYVYNNLGDAFYKVGNVPLAKEYAEKSMEMFRSLEDERGIAYSFINLGSVARISEEYASALRYFENAIALRKSFRDTVGIASASLEVAETLSMMGKYDSAMVWYRTSLDKHREIDNKNYIAYSLHGMGKIYLQEGRYDSAYDCFRQALDLSLERNNHSAIISNQQGLAMLFLETGREEQGEELLTQALDIAKKEGHNRDLLSVYKKRGEFHQKLENFEKATDNYQKYIIIYDSLYQEMQFQTMEEIRTRFGMTEQLNRINENLEKKQRKEIYLVVFIVILITITFVMVMRYRIQKRLRRELEESNRAKDKVFSIISHDLVSPFNVLIGFSNILQKNIENGRYDKVKIHSQAIHDTASETYKLITNLLHWARAQRKKIHALPASFNITGLLNEVTDIEKNQAALKDIAITTIITKPIHVYADPDLIRTVLINLVSNAIKFTNNGGHIELSAETQDKKVVVSVKDNGVGIVPEKKEQLFCQLTTDSSKGTDGEGGTGLGLLVCKEFIEISNGSIWVDTEPEKGSVFYFSLPMYAENN